MTHETIPERRLRAFLDAGGDPSTLDRWERLGEEAVDSLTFTDRQRRRFAVQARERAAGWPSLAKVSADVAVRLEQLVAESLADAELIEDPELARRFIAALPEIHRLAAEQRLDKLCRPYPLAVADRWTEGEHWSCDSCGEPHDADDGERFVMVSDRPGWSRLDGPLVYCAGCIRAAADALAPAHAGG